MAVKSPEVRFISEPKLTPDKPPGGVKSREQVYASSYTVSYLLYMLSVRIQAIRLICRARIPVPSVEPRTRDTSPLVYEMRLSLYNLRGAFILLATNAYEPAPSLKHTDSRPLQ